jgi:hypothetical protein
MSLLGAGCWLRVWCREHRRPSPNYCGDSLSSIQVSCYVHFSSTHLISAGVEMDSSSWIANEVAKNCQRSPPVRFGLGYLPCVAFSRRTYTARREHDGDVCPLPTDRPPGLAQAPCHALHWLALTEEHGQSAPRAGCLYGAVAGRPAPASRAGSVPRVTLASQALT